MPAARISLGGRREVARIIVTRPAPDAQRWADDLAARGLEAIALPLIAIATMPDAQALAAARNALDGLDALFFVSGNAATHFFASNVRTALVQRSWTAINTRAWAPGPGTAAALIEAGVPPESIDAPALDAPQFDSEALWHVVQPQVVPGLRVLMVRGAGADGQPAGRDWMADRLRTAGASVAQVAAYRRAAPVWAAAQAALARAALADGSVWLFSSSEAIGNLKALLPDARFEAARAIATHPRIAQTARAAGFGVVCESRPGLDSLERSLKLVG